MNTALKPAKSAMELLSHGHSDVGYVRETNEDSFLNRPDLGIFAVSDGVGGLPYEALASKLAVQNYEAFFNHNPKLDSLDTFKSVFFKIHQNARLWKYRWRSKWYRYHLLWDSSF